VRIEILPARFVGPGEYDQRIDAIAEVRLQFDLAALHRALLGHVAQVGEIVAHFPAIRQRAVADFPGQIQAFRHHVVIQRAVAIAVQHAEDLTAPARVVTVLPVEAQAELVVDLRPFERIGAAVAGAIGIEVIEAQCIGTEQIPIRERTAGAVGRVHNDVAGNDNSKHQRKQALCVHRGTCSG